MAKNQHNAGLHYRPLNQLGLSNFNDYIENPIDSRFKFNPPPLKCGKLFGLCKADRQKEKLQKHCPWHPLLKMKAFTLEINGEAEYIWYCKECDCYYMNPFWRNGEKRILDVYHKVPVRRLIKNSYIALIMICRLPKSSRLFCFRRTLFVFAHIISSIIHQSKMIDEMRALFHTAA